MNIEFFNITIVFTEDIKFKIGQTFKDVLLWIYVLCSKVASRFFPICYFAITIEPLNKKSLMLIRSDKHFIRVSSIWLLDICHLY